MKGLDWMFELRGPLSSRQRLWLGIGGVIFVLIIWHILTMGTSPIMPPNALPHPLKVLYSYADLLRDNELIRNALLSISLNLGGYIKALAWSIPIGMLLGLIPMVRGAFQSFVDAGRFVPLTALTMLFIVWFGIGTPMKMNFLAFGIFIYLVPVIIQRIDEVDDVYIKTVYTLGASKWQTFRSVYFPAVLSKLSDDIRVLTAISWTYIIVAENMAAQGGLGVLLLGPTARQGRTDKIYALIILIMLIGVLQDRIFAYLDHKFFPHKYQTKNTYEQASILKTVSVWDTVSEFTLNVFGWVFMGLYLLLALNEFMGFLGDIKPFEYFFGDRVWVVHFIFAAILIYNGKSLFKQSSKKKA